MNFLIFCLFWVIGLIITSFTLIPILIILVFGIPITKKLERLKLVKQNNGIIGKYFISIIMLSVVFFVAFKVIQSFIPNGLLGFIVGAIIVVLFGLGKIGKNPDNIKDYIQTNKDSFMVDEAEITLQFIRNNI